MAIAVTPEGREGLYLADRSSLKVWIEAKGFDAIHNFTQASGMVLGADHEVAGVLRDIDLADRVAILTGDARRENLNHALALIMPPEGIRPERLEMYDIGEVTEADLRIEVGT